MTRNSYEPATDYLDLGALLPNLRRYALFFLLILIVIPTLFVFGTQNRTESTVATEAKKFIHFNLLINRNNMILPMTPGLPGPEKVMYSEIDVNLVIQNTVQIKELEKHLKANNSTFNFTVNDRTVNLIIERNESAKPLGSSLLKLGTRVVEVANSEANKIATTYAQQAMDLIPDADLKNLIGSSAKNFRYFTVLNNPKVESVSATDAVIGSRAYLKWLFLGLVVAFFVAMMCLLVISYCGRTIVTERMIHLESQDTETLGQVRKKHVEDWLSIGAQVTQHMKNFDTKIITLVGLNVDSLTTSAGQLTSSLGTTFADTPIRTFDSIYDAVNEVDAETLVIGVCQRHRTTKKQLRDFVKLASNSSSKNAGIVLFK